MWWCRHFYQVPRLVTSQRSGHSPLSARNLRVVSIIVCVTSTRWFVVHGWRASSTHTTVCVVSTRQVVCHDSRALSALVLRSEICRLLEWLLTMLSSSFYPEHWFESASFSPFAHSPVCSKQLRHVKAKSWTWLSEAIFCDYLVGYFVGIGCSTFSTIPAMTAHYGTLSVNIC